jgi:ATP-dependent protease ClpP protease subunit
MVGDMTTPATPPPDTIYVSFSAEINANTTESLIAAMAQCTQAGAQNVHLLMSTPGGSVMHGMNLYNMLRAFPFTLTTHNVGNVDSIGNAIFLAGEHRFACAHSTFMFHGVGFNTEPGARLEEKILRERLDGILADQKRISSIMEDRTNLAPDDIEKLFLEAQTKDAAYAVGAGIVHEIKDVAIPSGAPIMALVFQR